MCYSTKTVMKALLFVNNILYFMWWFSNIPFSHILTYTIRNYNCLSFFKVIFFISFTLNILMIFDTADFSQHFLSIQKFFITCKKFSFRDLTHTLSLSSSLALSLSLSLSLFSLFLSLSPTLSFFLFLSFSLSVSFCVPFYDFVSVFVSVSPSFL